jgi:hypothetical protein
MSIQITYEEGNNNVTQEFRFSSTSNSYNNSNGLIIIAFKTLFEILNNINIVFISKLREIDLRE